MYTRRSFFAGAVVATALPAIAAHAKPEFEIIRTAEEWRELLTPEAYWILREHGTEPRNISPLNFEAREGRYACAGCAQPLFSSSTKYDSRTGWPSFWDALPGGVGISTDWKLFFPRREVHCSRCGGHIGHVFRDGPKPTGQRYCMNGLAMDFVPDWPDWRGANPEFSNRFG